MIHRHFTVALREARATDNTPLMHAPAKRGQALRDGRTESGDGSRATGFRKRRAGSFQRLKSSAGRPMAAPRVFQH
jgi:hypothetical protein